MEAPGGDGWVCEGDKAPSFELPDSQFKAIRPMETTTKVRGLTVGLSDLSIFDFGGKAAGTTATAVAKTRPVCASVRWCGR